MFQLECFKNTNRNSNYEKFCVKSSSFFLQSLGELQKNDYSGRLCVQLSADPMSAGLLGILECDVHAHGCLFRGRYGTKACLDVFSLLGDIVQVDLAVCEGIELTIDGNGSIRQFQLVQKFFGAFILIDDESY